MTLRRRAFGLAALFVFRAMIRSSAALAVVAMGAQCLQVMRGQAQVPVERERLNVIDIEPAAVARRTAAENAGRVLCEVIVAQPFPFRCFIERLDHARRCALAADEWPQQPCYGQEQEPEQITERRRTAGPSTGIGPGVMQRYRQAGKILDVPGHEREVMIERRGGDHANGAPVHYAAGL